MRGPLILDGGGAAAGSVFDRIVAEVPPGSALCLIDTALQGRGAPERLFAGYPDLRVAVMEIGPASARRPDTAAALGRCGGFFFNGGDPRALSEAFTAGGAGTPALAAVRARVERDGVMFSGSSAGAMIAGELTLCECSSKSSVAALTEGHLFQAPGFGLVDGVLIDAHFFARGLLGRHLYALAGNRIPVGVGIDEGTAVMVPRGGGPWKVLGTGAVALIRTPARPRVDRLSGFTLSLLAPGDIFDPQSGVVSVAPERRPLDVRRGARPLVFQDAFAPQRVREMIERLARSGADEASASVPGAAIRVVLRRTAATRVYSDGRRSTVLDLAVSIDRPAG